MKEKSLCLPFLFMLALIPHLFSQENLSSSANNSSSPRIAVDTLGRIMVVWIEKDWPVLGIRDIFYTTKINGSWSGGLETASQLYDSRSPDLVSNPSEKIHLVYADGQDEATGDIFHQSFNFEEGYWSNIERVHFDEVNSSNPKIRVSKKDKIQVCWVQEFDTQGRTRIVIKEKNEAGTWPELIKDISVNTDSSAVSPSIDTELDSIHACWMDDQNGLWNILYAVKTEGLWNSPVVLMSLQDKSWPILRLDNNGKARLIYSQTGNIFFTRKEDQSWSLSQVISSGFCPDQQADFLVFKNNTLHSVWIQEDATGKTLYYGKGTPDGQWLAPIKIADGQHPESPQLAMDDNGHAHIVWADQGVSNKKDIFFSEVTPTGPMPIPVFSTSEDSGIAPFFVDFDASLSSPGQGRILSYWWDFGDGTEMVQGSQVSHTFEKSGTYRIKLFVTNTFLALSSSSQPIDVLPGPFPPSNILAWKAEERGLFIRIRINALTWRDNPKNTGKTTLAAYSIYRKLKNQEDSLFRKIGQVSAGIHKYADRDFQSAEERDFFTYAVAAVDNQGREGPKGIALFLNAGVFKKKMKLK